MKRIALTSMAALIALAVAVSPATAETVQSVQKFEAKVTPTKAGTKKKPTPVSLFANPYFDDISPDLGREVQFATVNANVFFPQGRRLQRQVLPLLLGHDGLPGREAVPQGVAGRQRAARRLACRRRRPRSTTTHGTSAR